MDIVRCDYDAELTCRDENQAARMADWAKFLGLRGIRVRNVVVVLE